MARQHVVEVRILHDVKDRSEGFFENWTLLLWHFDDSRTHIVSVFMASIDAFAALYLAAVSGCFLECLLHVVESNLVDQWTNESSSFERRADGNACISLLKTWNERIINAFVHEQTTERRATLTSGAHCAESDCAQCHVEICRWADDTGIVAAEFEDCTSKTLCKAWTNFAAHAGRTGCRKNRNLWAVNENFTNSTVTEYDFSQTFWSIAKTLDGALQDCVTCNSGEQGLFRWLPDNCVTANDSESGVPCPDSNWEVEGRDNADNAERMPGFHHAMASAFGCDGETVELTRQTDCEIADVDHFLYFAEAFRRNLASFERNETAEIFLGSAEFFTQETDQFATLWSWNSAPCAESFVSLVDDLDCIFFAVGLDRSDLFTGDRAEASEVARRVD